VILFVYGTLLDPAVLARVSGEAALVRTDRLDALNREAGLTARPVAIVRGYALVVP
jgi:hypothetical protein